MDTPSLATVGLPSTGQRLELVAPVTAAPRTARSLDELLGIVSDRVRAGVDEVAVITRHLVDAVVELIRLVTNKDQGVGPVTSGRWSMSTGCDGPIRWPDVMMPSANFGTVLSISLTLVWASKSPSHNSEPFSSGICPPCLATLTLRHMNRSERLGSRPPRTPGRRRRCSHPSWRCPRRSRR